MKLFDSLKKLFSTSKDVAVAKAEAIKDTTAAKAAEIQDASTAKAGELKDKAAQGVETAREYTLSLIHI